MIPIESSYEVQPAAVAGHNAFRNRLQGNASALLRTGGAILACALAAPSPAQAETPQKIASTTPEAARDLRHRILHDQKVTLSTKKDLRWSEYTQCMGGVCEEELFYKVAVPLVAKIRDEKGVIRNRFFRVDQYGATKSSLHVTPIPRAATNPENKNNANIYVNGTTFTGGQYKKAVIKFNKKYQPFVKIGRKKQAVGDQRLTKTQQLDSKVVLSRPSVGKRLANTEAIDRLANVKDIQQISEIAQSFFGQYGMKINILAGDMPPAPAVAQYEFVVQQDVQRLIKYTQALIDEWAKYPSDLIARSRLRSISLVKNLIRPEGFVTGGLLNEVNDNIIFSIENAESPEEVAESVHHEFAHFLLHRVLNGTAPPDPAWESFNPPGFTYGPGGLSCYYPDNTCKKGDHIEAGFVSGYAMSGPQEDPAETHSYLMTAPKYLKLTDWIKSDPFLAQKVASYKRFLRSLSPQMTDEYFSQINK